MRHSPFLFSLLVLWSTAALSSEIPSPTLPEDPTNAPMSTDRILTVKSWPGTPTSRQICVIRLHDKYFGFLDDSAFITRKMPVQLTCHAQDDAGLLVGRPIGWDHNKKKWVRDFQNRIAGANGVDMTLAEKRTLDNAIHFSELTSRNAEGFAYTEDMTFGDDRNRTRTLHFCLFHGAKALCGDGEMGYLQNIRRNRKNDLTPYALQILRSIEFIDEPRAPTAADRTASGPP